MTARDVDARDVGVRDVGARDGQGVVVRGVAVGPETRCAHYDGERDVVAVRFPCCGDYYPCFRCHRAVADHDADRWPPDRFDDPAVLCGVCGTELAVADYLDADDACPACDAPFNPGCREHYDRYFERTPGDDA